MRAVPGQDNARRCLGVLTRCRVVARVVYWLRLAAGGTRWDAAAVELKYGSLLAEVARILNSNDLRNKQVSTFKAGDLHDQPAERPSIAYAAGPAQ